MAIYYINPHTTTNGTGTYASPWSFNSLTRTGLAANDEIRIMGVALTSLLTATSYTATVTSQYQLNITAGGGLGADWAVGNIGYLPAYDTFFRVYAVATNIISAYTLSSVLPIYDWSATSLTVRRVDTATYPASTTLGSVYFGSALNNITITDCWTSATTRVTDGTVKSLINCGAATANLYLQSVSSTLTSGWSVDCANTAAVCFNTTTSATVSLQNFASSSTITFGQIYGWGSVTTNSIVNGSSTNPVTNVTVNITHLAGYYPIGNQATNGTNITLNLTHVSYGYIDYIVYSTGSPLNYLSGTNNTINIVNIHAYSIGVSAVLFYTESASNLTVAITGTVDVYASVTLASIFAGYMSGSLTVGPSVIYYYNKRASITTTVTNLIGHPTATVFSNTTQYLPDITINNGWTTTNKATWTSTYPLPYASQISVVPSSYTLSIAKSADILSNTYPSVVAALNALVTFRNGDAPFEILAITNVGQLSVGSNTTNPQVTTDAAVYRTTGPSLKSYLGTRSTTYWGNSIQRIARSFKTIKVPCVSGTSYTISGYTRTDDAAYVNGDLRVAVYLNNVEITGQDMTTASYNAWEGFTLTFTAAQTAEYIFAMKMYYETGAKSYWLDDFTIA